MKLKNDYEGRVGKNKGTILTVAWRDWGRPQKTARVAGWDLNQVPPKQKWRLLPLHHTSQYIPSEEQFDKLLEVF